MKKFIFGLIATVMFGFVGNAQKISQEEARQKLASSMVELVDQCSPSYKKGMPYNDFIKLILGGTTGPTYPVPTEEGNGVLRKAFELISKGSTSQDILKNYNGYEMAKVVKLIDGSKTQYEAAVKVFGIDIVKNTTFGQNVSSERAACCKWLGHIFTWLWDNHDEVISVIIQIIQIFNP